MMVHGSCLCRDVAYEVLGKSQTLIDTVPNAFYGRVRYTSMGFPLASKPRPMPVGQSFVPGPATMLSTSGWPRSSAGLPANRISPRSMTYSRVTKSGT